MYTYEVGIGNIQKYHQNQFLRRPGEQVASMKQVTFEQKYEGVEEVNYLYLGENIPPSANSKEARMTGGPCDCYTSQGNDGRGGLNME